MWKTTRVIAAALGFVLMAAGPAALAQSSGADSKPVKKTAAKHARKSATPPKEMYLRATGSEPAPKASK